VIRYRPGMMKRVVAAVLVLGSAYAMKGCLSRPAPDEKLARQFGDICKIARLNVDSPVRGVRSMGAYLQRNLGDMTGEFGDTLMLVESIADDAKHDERAHLAHDRIAAPLRACEDDMIRFMDAVQNDPEAKRIHDEALDRAVGTLMILIGNNQMLLPMHELEPLLRR
jgi:hypothetical protein